MRRIISLDSVKAFYLDRNKLIKELQKAAAEAMLLFPEIQEIRLVGSVARGEQTGLSDVDLFIVVDNDEENAVERIKPYYRFFSEKLRLSLDIITALKEEADNYQDLLKGSILLG